MSLGLYVNMLLPEIVMLIGAGLCLFMGLAGMARIRAAVGPAALAVVIVAWLVSVGQHNYEQFSGLTVDALTLYVRLITLTVGAVLVLVNWYQPASEERGEYFAMMLLSMVGVMLVASSNDLLVLFFALELVSVPTYVLVALSRRDVRAQEACSKYFFLGALAAALTAYGLSFIYGTTGTTTMTGADSIAERVLGGETEASVLLLGLLLTFGGLCFKIAAVPFHGYVGDVYQGAGAPLTGLLAFIPKLAGFVGLIKLLGLLDWDLPVVLQWTMWIVAAATMTAGNVLALMQNSIKRMLAYSSVAHSGYMLIGLLVGPMAGRGPFYDGLAAVLFYVGIYGLMNLGAFAVVTYLSWDDHEAEHPEQLAGLSRREPLAALALTICMFSLMGLPPTAGFLGKVYVFSSAFASSDAGPFGRALVWLAVIGVINSAIAAAYYLRVVGWCYLSTGTEHLAPRPRFALQFGTAICCLLMVMLFVWPQTLLVEAGAATSSLGSFATRQVNGPALATVGEKLRPPDGSTLQQSPQTGRKSTSERDPGQQPHRGTPRQTVEARH